MSTYSDDTKTEIIHTRSMKNLVVFTVLFLATACATSPGGRKQLLLMPKGQMDSMGQQSFAQMKSQQRTIRSGPVFNWVTCTTNEILRAIGENPSRWEVQLFADDSPNAFALPGNKMGVHTGNTRLAGSTAELAAVIGHEIAHVKAEHGNERVSQNLLAQGGLVLANIAFGQSEQTDQLIMAGLGVGVLMPFSRAHEKEADLLGLDYLVRAG
ncbi:MAG: M48 family metallopeptidase [Bdellovibrionales bacterium]|nr:M48 family metallopeptidase [Bdellovibrionales bacterium]